MINTRKYVMGRQKMRCEASYIAVKRADMKKKNSGSIAIVLSFSMPYPERSKYSVVIQFSHGSFPEPSPVLILTRSQEHLFVERSRFFGDQV